MEQGLPICWAYLQTLSADIPHLATCAMPCTQASNTHTQHTFVLLIVWGCFWPECVALLTPLTLLWHKAFPPHVEGIPTVNAIPTSHPALVVGHPPIQKMKHPNGECGRNPNTGWGFQLKETLSLPNGLYEEIQISGFEYSANPTHFLMFGSDVCPWIRKSTSQLEIVCE